MQSQQMRLSRLASLTRELLWLKQLLRSFHISVSSTMVLCDSKSAIQVATNPTCNDRTKHIDIDCHFICEHVAAGFLNLIHVTSKNQLADVLTKALPKPLFHILISKLGILNIYSPT